ncbi:enoyl-CoA hydratase/isomerase family protein [Frankia sp. AiPs1]|uniref:enoyl-CoA hydratase/isomerase family protein n=1 Tax=Frankia sp. AiPs1 TaxID=573493 RepID=UPI0020434116|nr:enoyl-CoA hydratase/isomerase family protein [Frankia sp. AiPs1]MCM3924243.1 enoyl-CoA hydratase/isomerase family protein [Frankia sp. AiPs1]
MAVPAAADSAAAGLRVEVVGPVATIRLSGSGDPGSLGSLGSALDDAQRNMGGDVRVAVLRVGGPDPSAADAADAAAGPPGAAMNTPIASSPARADPASLIGGYRVWREALERLTMRADLISVAAVAEVTEDVGTALAVACDLRIFAADAGLNPVWARCGLLPAAGALTRLAELVGWSRAFDLCLTGGQPLGAAEAARLGLAQRLVPRLRLDDEVDSVVAGLLAASRAVTAEVKALLRGARPAGRSAVSTRAMAGADHRDLPDAEGEAWARTLFDLLDASRGIAAG